jgi:hypothetical protein
LTKRNQIILLAAIGTIWIGLAAWQLSNSTGEVRVPLTNVSGRFTSGLESTARTVSGLHVNMELWAAAKTLRDTNFSAPRNIFAPPTLQGGLPVAGEMSGDASAPPPEETLRYQAAIAALAQFRYVGYLQMGDTPLQRRPIAVLSKNDEIHVVRVGEKVDDRVIVKQITPEEIMLVETTAQIEQTITLSEEPSTDLSPEPPPQPPPQP